MSICLPKKVRRVYFLCLLGSQEQFPWKCWHKSNPYIVTRGTAVMVVSVLFCQHVLHVRVLRINRVYTKEIKAVSYSQWQPTRWPFLPHIPLSVVLTLPPDGWVCPLEGHSILRSSCPRWFRPRKPHGSWSISVWNLLPDGRGCTPMPCPQEVSSLHCLWESSEVALPAGTPLPWGSPLAKQFFSALFSTDAKDVCLRSQWICHRNLLYWDYMCY